MEGPHSSPYYLTADAGVEKCEDLLSAWADIPPLPAQYLNRICTQKEKEKESKTLKPGEKRGTKPKKVTTCTYALYTLYTIYTIYTIYTLFTLITLVYIHELFVVDQ